jgi:transcriptional regulator with XRE-family HTH domain
MRYIFTHDMGKSIYTSEYTRFLRALKKARIDAGMGQNEVAKAFGKPQSFVSKCESGERRVDIVELQRFAELYKRPLNYFIRTQK